MHSRRQDLYFDDGSNPSTEILRNFIQLADEVISAGGAVAVHCKAGLGRTGVLIGAYLIWKHGFSASEVIGFMRIMRPGCVVGPQQHFMYENFVEWIRWGVQDSAMRDARALLERERVGDSATSNQVNSRKRAAEEELDEEDRLRYSHASVEATPVTPRAQKMAQQDSAQTVSAVPPSVKPAPCVGQPRKSPSPSRKRPANTRNTGSSGNEGAASSRVPSTSRVPSASSSRGLGYMPRSISDESVNAARTAGKGPSTPGPSARLATVATVAVPGTPGRVLGEAQRLNVQGGVTSSVLDVSVTPRAVPAASSVARSDTKKVTSASASRVSGHQRSRSAVAPSVVVPGEEDVFGQVLASPGCPTSGVSTPRMGVTRTPTFRASPLIKDKYGLRDTGSNSKGSVSSSTAGMEAPATTSVRSAASSAARSTSGSRSATSKATPNVNGTRPVSSAKERLARFYASAAANGGGPAPTPSSLSSRRARGITEYASSTASRPVAPSTGSARSTSSASSRIGRVVRSRRSSMGEADVQA